MCPKVILTLFPVDNTSDPCKCKHSDALLVGAYCEKWMFSKMPWCILGNSSTLKSCPGAMYWKAMGVYLTYSKEVCKKSQGRYLHRVVDVFHNHHLDQLYRLSLANNS